MSRVQRDTMALSRARPGIDPTWRRTTAGARQRAHAVPRAGPDPVAGREHRAPVVLHELRPAGLVPGCRPGFPGGRPGLVVPALDTAAARPAGGLRPRVPGVGRPLRERPDLLHRPAHHGATGLVDPPAGLPPGRRHPGRSGRGRRSLLRRARAADGVPLGPDRIPAGDPAVHGAVAGLGTVRGLGRHRRGGVHGAGRWPLPGARRAGRDRGRGGAAAGDDHAGCLLVAVLQDHADHEEQRDVRHAGAALGQRRAPPDHGHRRVEAREGRPGSTVRRTCTATRHPCATCWWSGPAPARTSRSRCAWAPSTWTRSTSTRGWCRSACRATRTTPTRTLGSPGTSTTAARSCRTRTDATT